MAKFTIVSDEKCTANHSIKLHGTTHHNHGMKAGQVEYTVPTKRHKLVLNIPVHAAHFSYHL